MSVTFRSGEFSVTIDAYNAKKQYINGYNYVALYDQTEYSLILQNHSESRCDTSVTIDGRNIGKFRIHPFGSINVERPVSQHKRFIFLRENSSSGKNAGIHQGRQENGLVNVTFYPERNDDIVYELQCDRSDELCGSRSSNSFGVHKSFGERLSAGATALTGHSSQSFRSASPIRHIDPGRERTISFRMITTDDQWGSLDLEIPSSDWPQHRPYLIHRTHHTIWDPVQDSGTWIPPIHDTSCKIGRHHTREHAWSHINYFN